MKDFIGWAVTLVGDVHGQIWPARQALLQAHKDNADHVIFLGDTGVEWTPEFIAAVSETAGELQLTALTIDGNHEDHRFLRGLPVDEDGFAEIAPNFFYLPRGTAFTINGVKFVALGGANSIDKYVRLAHGDIYQPEENITLADMEAAVAHGTCDVLLCHDAPEQVPLPRQCFIPGLILPDDIIEEGARNRELLGVATAKLKPTWVLHGHYHTAYMAAVTTPNYAFVSTGLAADGNHNFTARLDLTSLDEITWETGAVDRLDTILPKSRK